MRRRDSVESFRRDAALPTGRAVRAADEENIIGAGFVAGCGEKEAESAEDLLLVCVLWSQQQ
jgi:hypothetical protein